MTARRIGVIWPAGGAEYEYYQYADAVDERLRIILVTTPSGGEPGKDHDIQALLQTGSIEWLSDAARRIALVKADVAFWACTSASFAVGRKGAEEQLAAIERVAGCPASSTSLAFVAALQAFGAKRVSILATYPEPASRAFEAFLGEFGIEVAHLQWLDAPGGWEATALDPGAVQAGVRAAAEHEADAVLVPDTALPTLAFAERMEQAAGKPVLTANAVSLWQAMKLTGGLIPAPGYGRLLAGALD